MNAIALNAGRLQESQSPPPAQKVEVARSYLTRSWDLDNRDDELLGEHQSPLKPHHVSYLIARTTSETNMQPYSPSHAATSLPAEIDRTELKFQISQKAKVLNPVKMDFLGISSLRLWGAIHSNPAGRRLIAATLRRFVKPFMSPS